MDARRNQSQLEFLPSSAYCHVMMFPLSAYIEAALELARYDKLEDNTFAGEIPKLKGVAAFGKTLRDCENELRSVLEDWILVGLKLGHKLPVLAGIDLNKVPHGRLATT
jgi:predicted RNase H-like HicB family nuclease